MTAQPSASLPAHPDSPDIVNALLAEVSEAAFRGGPVPPDLAALWVAQERGDTNLLDSFELILLAGIEADDAVAPFAEDPASDPAAVAALRRFCEQVDFVAEALDSTLLGYWVPTTNTRQVDQGSTTEVASVVVAVDAHGQVTVQGQTFAEALIALTDPDDPDEAAEVVAELAQLGIAPERQNLESIGAAVDTLADPNELILAFLLEARLAEPHSPGE